MIEIIIFILSFFIQAQVTKPVIIKGFDGKTYVKYPNVKQWQLSDTVDANYSNNLIRVEYTNFEVRLLI